MVRIERRFPKAGPAERKAYLQRLFDIDRELLTLQLPKLHGAFVSDLYEARSYVDLVITRLSERPAEKA
jgi:hypothetical protein